MNENNGTSENNHTAFDRELLTLLRSDPTPPHREGFWTEVDAALGEAAPGTEVAAAGPADITWESTRLGAPIESLDGASSVTVALRGDELGSRRRRRAPVFTAAAAALIVAIAGLGFVFSRADQPKSTVVASDPDKAARELDDFEPGKPRVLVSPFVDLAKRSASLDPDPLFTVRTTAAGYWRVLALDHIDAGIWSSEGDALDVLGPLNGTDLDAADMASATIEILAGDALPDSVWIPSASSTVEVRTENNVALGYLSSTDTWILGDQDQDWSDLGTYEITYDPVGLSEELSPQRLAELTELPNDFSATARALAEEWADGGDSPLAKAQLILSHFYDDFTYVPAGYDPGPGSKQAEMDQFLTLKTGNIEQYASTYAAMVRAVGVPSRVVVGYTQGAPTPNDPTLFVVRAGDAHAWVEIYVDGRWLQVETTTRGTQGLNTNTVHPIAGDDHWHAIYAMYDCRSGDYLPPILSSADPLGIHSHDDGLIHIHPFFEQSAGENATLRLFFDAMGVELTDGAMTLHDGTSIPTEATCDGQPAQLHVRKWQFDFVAATEAPNETVTDDLGSIRFINDREVYVIALAPLDAPIKPIPEELFERLDDETGALTFPDVITEATPGSG